MLEIEEIEKIAETKRLSLKNAEKDYLLEMLLFVLSKEAGRTLVFKGGTALYKLHSLDRFSEDLDFTLCSVKFDVEKLCSTVLSKLKAAGINGRIKEVNDYASQKNVKLELRGPLFDGNPRNATVITIDISLKEKPVYEAELKKIFPSYQDIPAFDVFVMPLKEMFAEKIRALLTRDKARDLYDVWFLFNKGAELDIKDVNKKLRQYDISFDIKILTTKIDEKQKSWKSDLNGLIFNALPDFDIVKRYVLVAFEKVTTSK